MSSDKVEMIVSLMEMHSLSIDDVAQRVTSELAGSRPTLREHVQSAQQLLSPGTKRGYATHLRRLVDGFGLQCTCRCEACLESFRSTRECRDGCGRCDATAFVGMGDLELRDANFPKERVLLLCELAERHAAKKALLENRIRVRKGLGRKQENGVHAREGCNWALRFAFRGPVEAGLLSRSPAATAGKVRRPPTTRRALSDTEVTELFDVVVSGGDDPELDFLIVWAGLELGCRSGGLLATTVGRLNDDTQTIELAEKGKTVRRQPATEELIAALRAHAIERGGPNCDPADERYVPDAPLLYYRDSTAGRPHPLTRRRLSTLHARVQMALGWARDIGFCVHELRHTSGTLIERIAGFEVARFHLGHAANQTTNTYTKASQAEHAAAFAAMTGRPHPLAKRH